MATVEERLVQVETQMEAFMSVIAELKRSIAALDQKIDRRFEAIERRFDAVDRRFEAVDRRFETIERRFESIDQRFVWLIGIQVATLLAIVAGLFGVATRPL